MIYFTLGTLIATIGVVASHRLFKTLVSPLTALLIPWSAAIMALGLRWVDYDPLGPQAWALIGGALATATLGIVAVSLVYRPGIASAEPDSLLLPRFRRALYASHGIGFTGFVVYVWALSRTAGIDAILAQPYLGRAAQSDETFIGAFQWARSFNYMNVLNCVFGYYIRLRIGHWPRHSLLLSIASGATVLFSFERTTPFLLVVWLVMVRVLMVPARSTSALKVACMGTVVGFILMGVFISIGNLVGKTFENNTPLQLYWLGPEWATDLGVGYMYLTGNLPAFQSYLGAFEPGETSGALTFAPVVKVLAYVFGSSLRPPDEVREFVLIPIPFNTSTYLNAYWSDFGSFGVLLVPLIMSVIATWSFMKARASKAIGPVLWAGLLLYALIHSVFVNKFISTPLWQYSACVWAFHAICEGRARLGASKAEVVIAADR